MNIKWNFTGFMIKKKTLLIFFVVLLSCANPMISKAEDSEDKSGSDWDSFYKQYQNNNFGKIISDDQFDKAYRERKGILSKEDEAKKIAKIKHKAQYPSLFTKIFNKDKNEKRGVPLTRNISPVESIEFTQSLSPLLRLTQDAYYQGEKIPKGFYLVDLIIKDGKYYFALREGVKTIITIDATVSSEPSKKEKVTFETELIDDITLKIKYFQPRGIMVESQLDFI